MPIVRFRNADNSSNGSVEQTLYYAHDANTNVTALLSTTGAVVERYAYDAYGQVRIFSATWATRTTSSYANTVLFAGLRLDSDTGLYHARNRDYHPGLGRFISRDPELAERLLQHYAYAMGNPLMFTDPMGLQALETAQGIAEGALGIDTMREAKELWDISDGRTLRGATMKAAAGVAIAVTVIDTGADVLTAGLKKVATTGLKKAGKWLVSWFIKEEAPKVITVAAKNIAEVALKEGLPKAANAIQDVSKLPPVASVAAKNGDGAVGAAKKNVLPQDQAVRGQKAPDALPPEGRKIGKNENQAKQLEKDIADAKANEATDIRVNQRQVDAEGNVVGINRPDLQYTDKNGVRRHIEYDTTKSGRGPGHKDRIEANDPKSKVELKTID